MAAESLKNVTMVHYTNSSCVSLAIRKVFNTADKSTLIFFLYFKIYIQQEVYLIFCATSVGLGRVLKKIILFSVLRIRQVPN